MSYRPPDEDADAYTFLNEGLALYHAGKAFEAHEVWEHAWNGEVGRTKLFLQALIQIAAALHKHHTGNPAGTSKLFAKARDKLLEVQSGASCWMGVDLLQLQVEVTRALAAADALWRGEAAVLSPPTLPRAASRDGVLYLHGFASGPGSIKARLITEPLVARGYAVAVPDQNEGDFAGLTISRALKLARRHLFDRTVVVGSSLGGYLGALLAASDERVKRMVLMAPAFGFAERMHRRYGAEAVERWRREGRAMVEHHAYGGPQPIGYGLLQDAEKHPAVPPIRVRTTVIQGRFDQTVPAEMVAEACRRFPAQVELVMVDDDHGLIASAPRAAEALERHMAELGLAPRPAPLDPEAVMARLIS